MPIKFVYPKERRELEEKQRNYIMELQSLIRSISTPAELSTDNCNSNPLHRVLMQISDNYRSINNIYADEKETFYETNLKPLSHRMTHIERSLESINQILNKMMQILYDPVKKNQNRILNADIINSPKEIISFRPDLILPTVEECKCLRVHDLVVVFILQVPVRVEINEIHFPRFKGTIIDTLVPLPPIYFDQGAIIEYKHFGEKISPELDK